MRHTLPTLIASYTVFFVLGGCAKPAPTKVAEQETPKVLIEFSFPSMANLVTLDPAKVQDEPTRSVIQDVYECLLRYNEQNEVAPSLAEKWDVSPDGKTYTFHLKKGVKFHNGKELGAEDVKYSIERACAKSLASPTAPNFFSDIVGFKEKIDGKTQEISGVKVIDPYTIQISIVEPRAYFISKLCYLATAILPKGGVPDSEITKVEESIGTGPYKFAEYIRNQEITLKANPNYHGDKILVDIIKVPIVKDLTTALNGYKGGKYSFYAVPANDIKAVKNDPNLKDQLHSGTVAATYYLEFNKKFKPYDKREVRQAIALAIDREKIVNGPLDGSVDVANVFLPKGIPGYRPDAKGLGFDVQRAKQLLVQAGYPGGKGMPPLVIEVPSGSIPAVRMAANVAIQLKSNLNLNTGVKQVEWGTMLANMNKGKIPFIWRAWIADYLDPANFLSDMFMTNRTLNHFKYSNPTFDKLCKEADAISDQPKRLMLYDEAEDLLLHDAIIIPICYGRGYYLKRPNVEGLQRNLMGGMPHNHLVVKP